MKIFDTHAHYDDRAFDKDREQVIDSLHNAGVCAVTDIGCDMKSSEVVDSFTKKYDWKKNPLVLVAHAVRSSSNTIRRWRRLVTFRLQQKQIRRS